MKNLLLTMVFIISVNLLNGQIINGGFEQWNTFYPVGWMTTNIPLVNNVVSSTNAHSGNYSIYGMVKHTVEGPSPVSIFSGQTARGFAVNKRYTRLTGYYKFKPLTNDIILITAMMMKDTNEVGIGMKSIVDFADNWTFFECPIVYVTPDIPDTIMINFSIVGTPIGSGYHVGSELYLDDISIDELPSDVPVQSASVPAKFSLHQNYPNPFNPSTSITYEIKNKCDVVLRIDNILGKEVATLVNKVQEPGIYTINFNAEKLNTGIYLYSLKAGNFTQTRKMVLIK